MSALLVALLVVLGVVILGIAVLATRIARNHREANQVVAGIATSAPAAWAGGHTSEARLHRRLRDVARAQRAALPGVNDLGGSLEREALALDERLIAVAALPESVRAEPLAEVAAAVDAIEQAAAALASAGAPALPGSTGVDDIAERLRLLAEARAELAAAAPGGPLPGLSEPAAADRPAAGEDHAPREGAGS